MKEFEITMRVRMSDDFYKKDLEKAEIKGMTYEQYVRDALNGLSDEEQACEVIFFKQTK